MTRFGDIHHGTSQIAALTEEEKHSPHVLDLTQLPREKKKRLGGGHVHPDRMVDVVQALKAGLSSNTANKLNANAKRRYEPHYDPKRPIASPFTEGLRMMAIGLAVVLVLNTLGVVHRAFDVKNEVASAAYESYNSILAEGPSVDAFQVAQKRFEKAQNSLWFLQNQRDELRGNSSLTTAISGILTAGERVARSGEHFLAFVEGVKEKSHALLSPKIQGASVTGELRTLYEEEFKPALHELQSANAEIQTIRPRLFPDTLRNEVLAAQANLDDLTRVLTTFDQAFPILLSMLGDEHPQRYLVLLENNNEARPGGGFIGSYMILDLNDGYLDGFTFHDVYDLDNAFHETIAPPVEVARLTDQWRFRDSNTSPDLAISAKTGMWFLDTEGGPSVDHVLSLDLTFVQKLLALTGPIRINSLPLPLAEDNFALILSYMVESKQTGQDTPKRVLDEFIQAVEQKWREQKPWLELGQLMQQMAREKHIALYSKHEATQTLLSDFGLTGAIPPREPKEDQFMLIHTSIGGNKTDAYVTQDIEHKTLIEENGALLDQVTLTRKHTWNDLERVRLKNILASFGFKDIEPWLLDLLGGGPNVSAIRVYAPRGSQLVNTIGVSMEDVAVEYDPDLDLTYFYFVDTVQAGGASTITLTYELPFTLDFSPLDEYRLNVTKQPGDRDTIFQKTITADHRLSHYRSFPEAMSENAPIEIYGAQGATVRDLSDSYTYETPLNRDLHMAQLWGR